MRIVLIALAAALAACGAQHTAGLNRWHGQSEAALYEQWGAPAYSAQFGDRRAVTYETTYNNGNICRSSFTLEGGVVVGSSHSNCDFLIPSIPAPK